MSRQIFIYREQRETSFSVMCCSEGTGWNASGMQEKRSFMSRKSLF